MLTTVAAGRVYNFSHAVGFSAAAGVGFQYPQAMTIGHDGAVYVVSRGNETNFGSRVGKITIGAPGDEEYLCEFAKFGYGEADALWPSAVAEDREGNVYVGGEWLHCISVFDEHGNFLYKWGKQGAQDGELNRPSGIAFDRDDNLYIVDSANNRIQKFTKDGTFLHKFGEGGSDRGQFNLPWGITIDNQGDIYVADWKNHRVQKFSPEGAFLNSFGTFGSGVGELDHPSDVAVDDEGDIYVCDRVNNRVQIFAPDGDVITSLFGDAQQISKWGQQQVDANPEITAARRRVKNPEPEWQFIYPTAVDFDEMESRIIVVDCQRSRLQIYIKDKNYVDPQFNL